MNDELVPLTVLLQAERTATWLYAGIGVKLKWSSAGKYGLSMQFDSGLPDWFHPGALAHSMPYAQTGTRVHVLVPVARSGVETARGSAIGDVLAHEFAHILRGFTHHSEAGVMKARWDNGDLEQMMRRPLAFSAHQDAAAIRSGLAKVLARSTGSLADPAERR